MSDQFISREEFLKATGAPKQRLFIPITTPDPNSAAYRFNLIDKVLEEWFDGVNSEQGKPGSIPPNLITKYEEACEKILEIRHMELDLIRS